MIVLRALGNAEIETAVTTLTPSQEIVFAAGLYLVLERGKRVGRARLASLLWPRVPEKARAHRLRQTILQLKKLGVTIRADRNTLHLDKTAARSDLDDLSERDLALSENQDLLEFLPGYNPHFSEEFRDWIDSKREQSHSALTRILLSTLQAARDSGNWMKVEQISAHCLALDTYNEVAVLARAEAYAMRGQKAAGVSLLDRYIEEMAPRNPALAVPATILRRRVLRVAPQSQANHFGTNEPAFVGRELEMAMLTRLLRDAQEGRGGGCLVRGEPGIGKTQLSSELAKFAELQGVRVERVACKRADMHQPLSAFVALVPGLRELPGALGCSQKSLLWLKRLTEFEASSEELPTRSEDSASPYTNLRSALFDLLDAVSEERCLLIIVEDVQWLDRASVTLFGAILEWAPVKKLFFLFNSREGNSPLMESLAPRQMVAIQLRPLANGEAASLIRTMIPSVKGAPDAEDLAWLINAGDGNPFFLQELTKQFLETGQRLEVPHSVAMVLDERISRLSGVARQLLEACAVLGENSNLERLEHVLEYRPHDLLSGLQELSTAGMLRARAVKDPLTQTLLIRHDLLSIEVLNGLAPASLGFLHRRCGIALERELLGSSISTSLLRACAFHWHHSGDSARAYELAVKCANHLLEIGLALDAATAFEGALGFCSSVEAQLSVLERIVHALRLAREWPALLQHVARIRALQDLGGSKEHHDELEILEFEARRTTEIAITPLLSRTLTCVYDSGLPPSHRVRVACDAFKLATVLPDLKELQRAYVVIKPLLADCSVDFHSRLQVEVVYNTMCGDLMEAVRFAKERIALAQVEGRPLLLANALTDLAFVLRRTGPEEEISAVLQEAYDIGIQNKLFAAARDYAERMLAFLVDNRRDGVETWMQRANDSHGDGFSVRASFSVNAYRVRIALLENRIDDAQQILQHAFDWQWVRHRKGWLAAINALHIRLHLALRTSIAELRPTVEELRLLYAETAMLGGQDYEIAALCAGLLYVGERTTAEGYLRDYLSQTRRDLTSYSRELAEIARALYSNGSANAGLVRPAKTGFAIATSSEVLPHNSVDNPDDDNNS
jgi:DNA-binding SARP family transcriptional activator